MPGRADLTASNLRLLDQGEALLGRLDDATYTASSPAAMGAIGGHFRHCLDFYLRFLSGIDAGSIDYDARARDEGIETSVETAARVLATVRDRLEALDRRSAERPVRVRLDAAAAADEQWVLSTIGRELQFLGSHTVHHYALIATLLRLQGVEPPADFGLAPSTVEHRRRSETVGR